MTETERYIGVLRALKDQQLGLLRQRLRTRETPEDRKACRQLIITVKALGASINSLAITETQTDLIEAVSFYADPMTYFAIAFIPDPPCGEFIDDFSDMGALGEKPGKKAREAWNKMAGLSQTPEQNDA